jgi:uncharacterized integral membrane protein
MSEPTTVEAGAHRSEGPPWKLIALLVVVVALGIFFFQNGDDAPVEFLWIDASWPVWLVIAISVAAGIVLDRLATWQWRRARRRRDDYR